jgi:hypothetical protein
VSDAARDKRKLNLGELKRSQCSKSQLSERRGKLTAGNFPVQICLKLPALDIFRLQPLSILAQGRQRGAASNGGVKSAAPLGYASRSQFHNDWRVFWISGSIPPFDGRRSL